MHFESVDELVLHLKKISYQAKTPPQHISLSKFLTRKPKVWEGEGVYLGKSHYSISLTIGQTIYGSITVPIFSIVIWFVNSYLVSKDHNAIVSLAS